MNTMLNTLRALDSSATSASAATVCKSLSQDKNEAPTAGIGTADAGLPIVRYWTVKFRHGGSALWDYTHVIACDPFKAAMVVNNRNRFLTEVEVVREIRSDEYEALTRKSP